MAKISKENIYGFSPSIAACAVFIAVFGVLLAHHIYLMVRKKCWYWWPFVAGIAFEVIGYADRIASAKDPSSVGAYAIQAVFILLPPAMFAASIYMILGRLLVYIKAQDASLVRIRWMTRFFVTGDVISFLMQGAGGGLQSSENSREIGENVVIGGLVVQLVFFGGFVITSFIADSRLKKWNYNPRTPGKFQWRWLLWALYGASALILVRSIFRIIEYAQGFDGYLMQHEVFMYVFDAVLMTGVVVIFSILHPALVMLWDQPIEVNGEQFTSSWEERKTKKPKGHKRDLENGTSTDSQTQLRDLGDNNAVQDSNSK